MARKSKAATETKRPVLKAVPPANRRKLIAFDQESFDSLDLMARDRMMTWQELADEAFRDLLRKHGRPVDLKDALRKSVRATQNKK